MTPETARADGEEGLRLPKRESKLQTAILAGVAAVALAGAGIAVWYKLTHTSDDLSPSMARQFRDLNLSFEPPPSPWARDEDMRVKLGSPFMLVYRRDNPEAYVAFGAKDYETRPPREGELKKGLSDALGRLVSVETLKQFDPEDSSWMGQEVKGFKFRAQLLDSGTAVEGQAYRFAYKGIGYWFLAWAGENNIYEEMKPEFAQARNRCKLLDLRKDWKEKQSAIVPFKGDRDPYTILDAEGKWKEAPKEDVEAEGKGADKKLILKIGKKGNIALEANLVVYVLPPGGDPITEARGFVTEHRAAELKAAGDYKVDFQERTGPPEEVLPNLNEPPAPVIRLESTVKGTLDQDRLHVISAAKIGDKTVVVHAWCPKSQKDTFEGMFMQIAGSLH
jgi:hypothetical protein